MKPRKPIRKVSVRRAAELKEYSKLRKDFLKAHPDCQCCLQNDMERPNPSVDIHHRKKRHGKRLNDTTWWLAVCRTHHRFIHEHPKFAYEKGWLVLR